MGEVFTSIPRLHGGRLCAGKTVGRENGGGRAVPEPPLRIATNLGLNALWSVYLHSNYMETSWATPQGCRRLANLGTLNLRQRDSSLRSATFRMTCGGRCVQSDIWGRKEGDGFPPPPSRGQALRGKNGWAREWWRAGGSRTAPTDCYQPGLERLMVSLFS